jgi:hypothetical protein
MKKLMIIYRLIASIFCTAILSCSTLPPNFTYAQNNRLACLEEKISIDGYYVSERGCDSTFYSVFRFFPDGSFAVAMTSELFPELIRCFFSESKKSSYCKYILHGYYLLEGNLIKTQVLWPVGNGCVIFRDYRILNEGAIVNVSDYVQAEYSNLGYIKNYPSFYENPCAKKAVFYPIY